MNSRAVYLSALQANPRIYVEKHINIRIISLDLAASIVLLNVYASTCISENRIVLSQSFPLLETKLDMRNIAWFQYYEYRILRKKQGP